GRRRGRPPAAVGDSGLPRAPDPENPGGDLGPAGMPMGYADGFDITGWTYSAYLQDEWKILPQVTINAGIRFDAVNGVSNEFQFSPRINVVWQPDAAFTVRAGY